MAKKIITTLKLVLWYEIIALLPAFLTSLVFNFTMIRYWVYRDTNVDLVTDIDCIIEDFVYWYQYSAWVFVPIAIGALAAALLHAYLIMRNKD